MLKQKQNNRPYIDELVQEKECVIIHDGTLHGGGAVDVTTEMAEALDADIIVGYSGQPEDWWQERTTSDIEILMNSEEHSFLRDLKVKSHFSTIDTSEYDVVITTGPPSKFVRTPNAERYHYLHHPPALAWSGDYSWLSLPREWVDKWRTNRISTTIANSRTTADRFEEYYGYEVETVITPPVDVERFSVVDGESDRVVMVTRLSPGKRPELAVDALRELDVHLDLVGHGPLLDELREDASDNVTVHGYVSDEELVSLVEKASAGLHLADHEDFEIVPIEYQAAGLPVVGVDEPNTNRQIEPGRNGTLVDPNPKSVQKGIENVLSTTWNKEQIAAGVEHHSKDRFKKQIKELVSEQPSEKQVV